MRRGMTDYPVGAMWIAETDNDRIGKIWLERRSEYLEMWMWSVYYTDNSGYKSDWNPSYRLCKKEIPLWNNNKKPIRFKRIK